MTTSRPYRAALSVEAAHEELRRDVARGWRRRDLVEAFIALPLTAAPLRTPVPAAGGSPRPRMLKALPSPQPLGPAAGVVAVRRTPR